MSTSLSIPVFNMAGQRQGEVEVDPAVLGGRIRPKLLKQAIVAFLDHQRHYSARTKGKADTEGSTRKLYRQKGTGNARMGQVRTPVRRGGGRAFAKRISRRHVEFPKQMRRLARNSAILAKIQSNDVLILSDLNCEKPKTKTVAKMFQALGVDRGCVLALGERSPSVYLSARNIPKTEVRLVEELNAYEVLRRKKLLLTKPAFERLTQGLKVKAKSA
jgi:large subunit ribosomal protein L4